MVPCVGTRFIDTVSFYKSCLVLVNFLLSCSLSFLALQRIANLLPAWYYNFRVTMVTWGDPELSCCDSSTISFITGKHPSENTVEMMPGARLLRKSNLDAMFHQQILAS